MEFQPGRNTTSVVVGIVDDDVYALGSSNMYFRLFTSNDVFVTIGPKRRLQVSLSDDEVYTVNIVSFPDFVTEGNDAAAVLVIEFQEPPGGSFQTPPFSTEVRVNGGSARGKLKYTSHSNSNLLLSFPKFTPLFSVNSDYRQPNVITRK